MNAYIKLVFKFKLIIVFTMDPPTEVKKPVSYDRHGFAVSEVQQSEDTETRQE